MNLSNLDLAPATAEAARIEPPEDDAASNDNARAAQVAENKTPAPEESVRRVSRRHLPQVGQLTEAERVTLWQQRFFEAQASFEEYLMAHGGWEAINDWIEANSSITARRFSLREPETENRAAYNVTRLVNQLRCYDSDISVEHDEEADAYTITNRDCGILRYRKIAALGKVRLTFKSPCDYCTKLNTKIIQKYVGQDTSVDVERRENGCEWKVTLSSNGTEKDSEQSEQSEQEGGGLCTLRSSPRPSMVI